MEHLSASSGFLVESGAPIRRLLPANDLGHHFQPWKIGKEAGASFRMSPEHLVLIRRKILAAVGPYENLVGQRDATHQTQGRGQLILPRIPDLHVLRDPQHDIPNGTGA